MNQIKPIEIAIRVYTAIINQSGTDAPVATVLHNTLNGDIVWTRTGAGAYRGTLAGTFKENKTIVLTGNATVGYTLIGGVQSGTELLYLQQNATTSPFTATDTFTNAYIEIRVYNEN